MSETVDGSCEAETKQRAHADSFHEESRGTSVGSGCVPNRIDQTTKAVSAYENERWEGVDLKGPWQCDNDWSHILDEVIQGSVSSVVLPIVTVGVEYDSAALGWVLSCKLVDEHV